MKQLSIITLLLLAPALVLAQQATYRIDPAESSVTFTLGDVLHTVRGTFQVKSGEVRFDPSTGAASGEVVVDPASGDSGNGTRDGRMKKNILEIAKYPQIVFRPDRVEGKIAPQGTSQVQVHGIFKIHGGEHEITAPAQVDMSTDRMTATLHFVVPYVEWGMKNPSTFLLRVSDKVEIDIRAVARISASRNTSSAPKTKEGVYEWEISGVVKDSKNTGLRGDSIRVIYVPARPGALGVADRGSPGRSGDPG